jgi:hypothetical protein
MKLKMKRPYVWMNIDALFTKLAFGEKWAILFWMEVLAFLIRIVAVRPMSAFNFLFIIMITLILVYFLLWHSFPDVVFE